MNRKLVSVLKITAFCLALVLVFVLAYVFINRLENKNEDDGAYTSQAVANRFYDGQEYKFDHNLNIILFIGVDINDYMVENEYYLKGGQADAIFIAAIDDDNEEIRLIQLDRDTITAVRTFGIYGDVADTINTQLALSYAYGDGASQSAYNSLRSVTALTEIPISNVYALTMPGVTSFVDFFGGIEITLTADCTWLGDGYLSGQTVTMDGNLALEYVRARSETAEGTNEARMLRHRQLINTLLVSRKKAEFENVEASAVFDRLAPFAQTNISSAQAAEFWLKLKNYSVKDAVSPDGEYENSKEYVEFYVDKDSLNKVIIDFCYKKVEQ